jgi:hypothetical protein
MIKILLGRGDSILSYILAATGDMNGMDGMDGIDGMDGMDGMNSMDGMGATNKVLKIFWA